MVFFVKVTHADLVGVWVKALTQQLEGLGSNPGWGMGFYDCEF